MDRKLLAVLQKMKPMEMKRLVARVEEQTARKHLRLATRRNALVRQLAAVDREIALLGRAAGRPGRPAGGRPRGGRRGRRGPTSRDVAHDILSKRGKPMELGELARAVLSSGRFHSTSAVFAQNLGMGLRKDARFKKIGRGMYGAAPAGGGPASGKASSRGRTASRKRRAAGKGKKKAGSKKK